MSLDPKQNFDFDIFKKQPRSRVKPTTLRYTFLLIGLILAAGGFYLYTHAQVPTGTDSYEIGNHAYETEIYSTSPILQILGLTCIVIGIASIIYALAVVKTKPKPQPKKELSAQEATTPSQS
jgi:multisubunit Na+/H+ antiporter MnhC subunit